MFQKFLSSIFLILISSQCFAFSYQGCSNNQVDVISMAVNHANSYADFTLLTEDPAIFIKWLGFNEINDIKDFFWRMKLVITERNIDFSCNCNQNIYAASLVAMNKNNHTHMISLCKKFWKAPLDGMDSKSGTIIHELSHFYDILGTHDPMINQQECLMEAKTKLGQHLVLENANSYEYLAEDISVHHNIGALLRHHHNHSHYHYNFPQHHVE